MYSYQVVVDNTEMLRQTECFGHQNDAQQFMLMQQIRKELAFPVGCILLGDKMYPNILPVMTTFSNGNMRPKARGEHRRACPFFSHYRIHVEHKSYQFIGSLWQQSRPFLTQTVRIVAEKDVIGKKLD